MTVVSIVVPVYNVERYLAECLDSILAQTYPSLEVICVNDGSTDGSQRILGAYPQVKVIVQANAGPGAARNAGLDAATGKYVYFLDSDDKIAPEAIAYLVSKCEADDLDQLIFGAEAFSDDEAVTAECLAKEQSYHTMPPSLCNHVFAGVDFLMESLPLDFPVTQQMRFFRREFLLKHNLRYPEGILHEDNAFAWISAYLSERICAIDKRFFLRRVRQGSIMRSPENSIRRSDGCLKSVELVLAFKPFWTTTAELRKTVLQYCIGPLVGNATRLSGGGGRWCLPNESVPLNGSSVPPPDPVLRSAADVLPWGIVLAYKKLRGRPLPAQTAFTKRLPYLKYVLPYGFIRYWTLKRIRDLQHG